MFIFQRNIHSLRAQRDNLRSLLATHQPAVACLQEIRCSTEPPVPINYIIPWSVANRKAILPPWHWYFNSSRYPSWLNLLSQHTSLYYHQYRLLSMDNHYIYYLSPSKIIDYISSRRLIAQFLPPLLLLGDFNTRNPWWGYSTLTPRCRHLKPFISRHTLHIF